MIKGTDLVCLDYSSAYTNVIAEEPLEKLSSDVLRFLSDTLRNTLGPFGNTTIIKDGMLDHKVTKDGYTVLKSIFIDNPCQRTILDMVKKISSNLVRKVGDGSTSAIVIANSLYQELAEYLGQEGYTISSNQILSALKVISEEVRDELLKRAKPINEDNFDTIETIAKVALNYDNKYASIIAKIYKEISPEGFITYEKSHDSRTSYSISSGFELFRGYLSPTMCNTTNRQQVVFTDKPSIIMFDDFITSDMLPWFEKLISVYVEKQHNQLCIIAPNFCEEFTKNIALQIARFRAAGKDLDIMALCLGRNNKLDKEDFEDLAVYLGCIPYRLMEEDYPQNDDINEIVLFKSKRVGFCEQIISESKATKFIRGAGRRTDIEELIKQFKTAMNDLSNNETYIEVDKELARYRRRINRLSNSMATIMVGGDSELEKQNIIYLVEDAIFACKSAFKFGYNVGGNIAIPVILNDKEVVDRIVKRIQSFEIYKYSNHSNETLMNMPYKLIEAIKNAFINAYWAIIINSDIWKTRESIVEIIENKKIFNLMSNDVESIDDTPIINSAETDIEILSASISIISLILTSNQMILLPKDLEIDTQN